METCSALVRGCPHVPSPCSDASDARPTQPVPGPAAAAAASIQTARHLVLCAGNGSNYTLGTGSTDLQLHPARLESLHDQQIVAISAAKFHSAAVSVDGRLLTWGWGRGGRLGKACWRHVSQCIPSASISGEGQQLRSTAVCASGLP